MPLKFIAGLSTNSAVDINFFLSKLSQGLAGFSVSRIRKLLFISLFCTKFQLDSLIFEDLRIVERKTFLLSLQITSPASLILYSNAIIVPSPLLWSLNYRFCHCRILARERQKDHRGCRYGSHTILYTISKFVSSSDWKLNLAFLRDFRDGVQVLSVAGRPVSDGVHVVGGVGGPPPSSLASLHPHQQESKRQRMTEPHNMPQLRIDTREAKVTTGEIEWERERERVSRSRL